MLLLTVNRDFLTSGEELMQTPASLLPLFLAFLPPVNDIVKPLAHLFLGFPSRPLVSSERLVIGHQLNLSNGVTAPVLVHRDSDETEKEITWSN